MKKEIKYQLQAMIVIAGAVVAFIIYFIVMGVLLSMAFSQL